MANTYLVNKPVLTQNNIWNKGNGSYQIIRIFNSQQVEKIYQSVYHNFRSEKEYE